MADERITLLICGRVQGVSYRASTVEAAQRLALCGFARNLSDGRVEVVAEGSKEALIALEQWCRKGPPAARVTSVEARKSAPTGEFNNFDIR